MFSRIFPKHLPSSWRLGFLIGVLQVSSVTLCILIASWTLKHDLGSIAAAVVIDDLGEYGALYNDDGVARIKDVFGSGKHEDDQGIRITRPDGSVVLEDIPAAMIAYGWPSHPETKLAKGSMAHFSLKHPSGTGELLIGYRALDDGNTLWFGRTNAEDIAYMTHIRSNLWIAGFFAATLALLPVWWFMHHVLTPVHEMMTSAQTLAQGRTDSRMAAPVAVPELQAFAAAYNTGLDRIQELTDELQRANDQLAHELRTPLARIRGNLEVFHDHTDDPIARDASARGLDEIDRAAQLVNTILTTRAGEHNALKLHLEVQDLRELLVRIYEMYQAAAEDRGLRFYLDADTPRYTLIDRERITQAVANFLDNAFAYTPRHGSVTLALQSLPTSVRICVQDSGPGLRADELERVWLRHARGSASSARTPGMGLGLSLVRAIGMAHKGSTGCRNRDEGGAEFWIEIPSTDPLTSGNNV